MFEKDLVAHCESTIGHRLYTIDAAHMNANTSGFSSNLFLLTRLDGGNKVLVLGYMLTTRHESCATWVHFLELAIQAGAQLQHRKAAVLSDRDKGIGAACRQLGINERKCAKHIFTNFENAGFWYVQHHIFIPRMCVVPLIHHTVFQENHRRRWQSDFCIACFLCVC